MFGLMFVSLDVDRDVDPAGLGVEGVGRVRGDPERARGERRLDAAGDDAPSGDGEERREQDARRADAWPTARDVRQRRPRPDRMPAVSAGAVRLSRRRRCADQADEQQRARRAAAPR